MSKIVKFNSVAETVLIKTYIESTRNRRQMIQHEESNASWAMSGNLNSAVSCYHRIRIGSIQGTKC